MGSRVLACNPERIVEVALALNVHRGQPVHASPRGGVCVHDINSHVPRLWQSVARQHAAPARTEMLAAYPVYVAGVGCAPPQKTGVLLVETRVPLAISMARPLDETRLYVYSTSS